MNNTAKNRALGVVIGRFQIPELHTGHLHLLDTVADKHERMLILLGVSNIRSDGHDPYSFEVRKVMLQSLYPHAFILPIKDSRESNKEWSERVDQTVGVLAESGRAVLYGSRGSFISEYTGTYPSEFIHTLSRESGTEARERIRQNPPIDSVDYRVGILHGLQKQYFINDVTVDAAIINHENRRVLLGKRGPTSKYWRFPGGFVEKKDTSFEVAVVREGLEEVTGIKVGKPKYIGSDRINDPRYKGTESGVITSFFDLPYLGGNPVAADDMGLVDWLSIDLDLPEVVVPEHQGLIKKLLRYKNVIGDLSAA